MSRRHSPTAWASLAPGASQQKAHQTLTLCSRGAALVTFSYSLTMIPDGFTAIDHASAMLRPGGVLGGVDLFAARKHSAAGEPRQPWGSRNLWALSFANDNVFLSVDHIPYLDHRFERIHFSAHRARVPYMLRLEASY